MVAIPISLSRNKPYTPQGGTQPLCVCVCVCVCVAKAGGGSGPQDDDIYPNLPPASSSRTDGV